MNREGKKDGAAAGRSRRSFDKKLTKAERLNVDIHYLIGIRLLFSEKALIQFSPEGLKKGEEIKKREKEIERIESEIKALKIELTKEYENRRFEHSIR